MKICLATLEYLPFFSGGISFYCQLLARGLAAQGCEVFVLTMPCRESYQDVEEDGIHIVRVPWAKVEESERNFSFLRPSLPETARILAHSQALCAGLLQLYREVPLDLVDSPVIHCLDHAFSNCQELKDLTQALTFHGSYAQCSENEPPECRTQDITICEQIELSSMRSADGFIGSASEACDYWQARLEKPIHVVPPPFERAQWLISSDRSPGELPERYGLIVGRLQSWKGVEDLARAFLLVAEKIPDLHMISVGRDTRTATGGTSMAASLQGILEDLWKTRWHWIPYLDPIKLAVVRRQAVMAICPSRWETFGYTVPEAMSDGVPVIVSDGAGAASLCRGGENALVFPRGNVETLAECMTELCSDPEMRSRLVEGGYRTVTEELDLEKTTRTRLSVYQEIVRTAQQNGCKAADDSHAVYARILEHLATKGRISLLSSYRFKELAGELCQRIVSRCKKRLRLRHLASF